MIYEVVSDMDASEDDKQIICILPKSVRQREYMYKYEPIKSCDTLEEAEEVMTHIQEIGVQAYFHELIDKGW